MQMLPGMCRGEQCGCASRSLALPLPAEALLPRGIGDCVLCQQLQEPFVVTLIGKKKEEKSVAEIQFWWKIPRGWCLGGGLCVFFAVFSLSLPLSFPLPQKKGFFFFLLFLVCCFLSYYQIRVENQACPQRSLLQPKKKSKYRKILILLCFSVSFFC